MEGNPLEKMEAGNLIKSVESEAKLKTTEIPVGEEIQIQTGSTLYKLEHRNDGFYLSGSEKYCPTPTQVKIIGSTWGGSMLMQNTIS